MKKDTQSDNFYLKYLDIRFSDSDQESMSSHQNVQEVPYLSEGSKQSPKKIRRQQRAQKMSAKQIQELDIAIKEQSAFFEDLGDLRDQVIVHKEINRISMKTEYEKVDWQEVKQYTATRVVRMKQSKIIKENWGVNDLKALVWIVFKYCEKNKIKKIPKSIKEEDWMKISSMIPGTTAQICQFRFLNEISAGIQDQGWMQWESIQIGNLVQKYGQENFDQIAKELYKSNLNKQKIFRTPTQCLNYWNSFINPQIKKGHWSQNEDIIMFHLYGNKKQSWPKISEKIKRTANAVKNRFYSDLQREIGRSSKSFSKSQKQTFAKNRLKRLDPLQKVTAQFQMSQSKFNQLQYRQIQSIKKRQRVKEKEFYSLNEDLAEEKQKNKIQGQEKGKVKVVNLQELGSWEMICKELQGKKLIKGTESKGIITLENGENIQI